VEGQTFDMRRTSVGSEAVRDIRGCAISVYLARRLLGAAWLEEVELRLAGLWFMPALAAVAVGRLRTSGVRDEREAALALWSLSTGGAASAPQPVSQLRRWPC